MERVLELLEEHGVEQLLTFTDPAAGLRAFLVVHDTTLGPACGGIRTASYPDATAAIADAVALAHAMTLKCSIAGLDAGGGKMVVMAPGNLDRARAFNILGDRVEELAGNFLTAGDLGTRGTDLRIMAARTRYVRTDEADLVAAAGTGLRTCLAACAQTAGRGSIAGLRVAVQGCGAIGRAVSRALYEAGTHLVVADLDRDAAARVATETGAEIVPPEDILRADVDVLAPCARGGVITDEVVDGIRAWAVCGAANNILARPELAHALSARDILFVPDMISSAGAVIHGLCDFLGNGDAPSLIARLGTTTRSVLEDAAGSGRTALQIAEERALRRVREAGR